eukprot:TRINITY_DN1767_c0_g1_i1.p2 TRINITY_DN1767_c0_g1~~TRINITY_DN1767_c0_g1_i1.p2  ORF type:complete len:159 (-),score=50.93 TRINITY_DN1767_c0_g1_i1:61-537(-)
MMHERPLKEGNEHRGYDIIWEDEGEESLLFQSLFPDWDLPYESWDLYSCQLGRLMTREEAAELYVEPDLKDDFLSDLLGEREKPKKEYELVDAEQLQHDFDEFEEKIMGLFDELEEEYLELERTGKKENHHEIEFKTEADFSDAFAIDHKESGKVEAY